VSRWKAAAIHLSISASIGLISALLIFGVWYPPPYSHAAGAEELVILLLGVDVVLGPLLTLVVYQHGKKLLRLDLALIATVQACAFFYGMSIVVRARPVFIVGAIDTFALVQAANIDAGDLAAGSQPDYRSLPWTGPRIVCAEMPTSVEERNALVFGGAAGKDIEKFPKYYVDCASHPQSILPHAQALDQLRKKHPEANASIDAWLHAHQRAEADVAWLPLTAPRANLCMLIERNTAKSLGVLPIDPW